MNRENYTPKTFVFPYVLQNYKNYLRKAGATKEKIQEMTKDIIVITLAKKE